MLMLDDEILAVVTAFKKGEQIQFFDTENSEWVDCIGHPAWDFNDTLFRVKPKPKLRPYESAEEFLAAQKEHGPYFFCIYDNVYDLPISVLGKSKQVWLIGDEDGKYIALDFDELQIDYKWQDGTPCGIVD